MGEPARAGEKVTPLRGRQLTLVAGGATVDTSTIASVKFAKGTREIQSEFKKGDDVIVTFVARVTDVKLGDKYDGHGNIAETVRGHALRIDELRSIGLERAQAAVTAAEAQAADDAADDGEDPAPEPAFDPEPDPDDDGEPGDGEGDDAPEPEPEPDPDDFGDEDE